MRIQSQARDLNDGRLSFHVGEMEEETDSAEGNGSYDQQLVHGSQGMLLKITEEMAGWMSS